MNLFFQDKSCHYWNLEIQGLLFEKTNFFFVSLLALFFISKKNYRSLDIEKYIKKTVYKIQSKKDNYQIK